MSKTKKNTASSIVWFDIPADDIKRAQGFYTKLFGWSIKPFPGMAEYLHVETGGPDATPDGGLMARKDPEQRITAYISVASVAKAAAKVEKLGGKICMPKTPVPKMGYFAICRDTEDNVFAIWERNERAK
jgi:uncharacterized protein